jgi:hypothetical protein
MKTALRVLFIVIACFMLGVTTWASSKCPLFGVPRSVATHPWFLATLADAYWGFVTFSVWVCYKESTWTSKVSWFVAIIALGNIAMSLYWLAELFIEPKGRTFVPTLCRQAHRTRDFGNRPGYFGRRRMLFRLRYS